MTKALVWMVVMAVGQVAEVPGPDAAERAGSALRAEREAIRDREAKALESLAGRLEKAGQQEAATAVRARIEPPTPERGPVRFEPLPDVVSALELKPQVQDVMGLAAILQESAEALFVLAGRAASAEVRRYALADECLRGVLRREPDHKEARRLLGYVPYQGGWALADAEGQLKLGQVQHPKYGWVPEAWVEHLEKGELPSKRIRGGQPSEWLPASEANGLRRSFDQGWRITTYHFRIQTNVPLDEAIVFGRRLEELYELFFSMEADLIGRERLPLARRFENPRLKPEATPANEKMVVWYFASQDEYVNYLRPYVGRGAEVDLGRYLPAGVYNQRVLRDSRSYFYRDPDGKIASLDTLHHEGSHQILFESAGRSHYERNSGNYWVWEGLGTYFETIRPQEDGSLLVGGLVGPRVEVALDLVVTQGKILPIGQLVAMDQRDYNAEPGVYVHYPESMVLAIYLMHGEGGRWRDDFLDYVRDAYEGRVTPRSNTLEEHLGRTYQEIQDGLVEYLRAER